MADSKIDPKPDDPADTDSSPKILSSEDILTVLETPAPSGLPSTADHPETGPAPQDLTARTAAAMAHRFALYEDLGKIGKGGMAVVREVHDRSLLRRLALKRLHPEAAADPSRLQRFLEEARITGQLDHPNIVPIHDLGRDNRNSWFFTMKRVQGRNLEQTLERLGEDRLEPQNLTELLQIFLKATDAVAFAHSRGVIHRDIKPSNIMVGEFGQVYIMDWGVAKVLPRASDDPDGVRLAVGEQRQELDLPGTVVGTPCYMAPEQVEGSHEDVDERTDVFALGGTLYHMLTGRAPYQGDNYYTLLVAALTCEPEAPEDLVGHGQVPAELARITRKAMDPDPAERHPSVMALKREVERFLQGSWHLPTRQFAAGAEIVREGEFGEEAFIITKGRCSVSKKSGDKPVELRTLGAGDVFGETAVFSATRRTATVRALEPVTVMVVDRDTLTRGLGLNSWMGRFVKVLSDRFREVDERLRRLEGEQDED